MLTVSKISAYEFENIELNQVADRDIGHLSGGELQRFAIGLVCVQKADV